ncbi:uncharacterized protein A4U43_C07F7180 [Asparagus officinalis]|uniref:WRKY domain-containing protein n=1 Tax=Asparagus officinalis TaxID=4686 RepID=A0A5P1EBY3_ASPOF|nr:WRKY transcription factor 55-like [Asparagus officinalis]ONK62707.1 uncharacterized protein A4U43_C07F7180 [Asparagus officinalis]
MDRAISQILDACKLTHELEASLPHLANQHPSLLKTSCENIVAAFNNAIHEINTQQQQIQAMDFFSPRSIEEHNNPFPLGFDAGCEMPFLGVSGGEAVVDGSSASSAFGRRPGGGSTGQRQSRKRRENRGMTTVRVPAVRTGNMENPPDDGYTWRKYGQKDILGSRFPRSYFRCTHKSFYGCDAKKQVQRLDEDPYTYEVTYCGDHTCHTSTTPLVLPSLLTNNDPQPQTSALMFDAIAQIPQVPPSTSIQLGSTWFDAGRDEAGAGQVVGPSECPVADLADVMFNSGSSGSSMDAIFSLRQQHDQSWPKDNEE